MEGSLVNEYTVLYVFCFGIACQSFLAVRSLKDVMTTLVIIAVCFLPAWFIPEPGDDKRFAVPIIWALFYAFTFSVVFRKSLLPRLSVLILICHTLLLYYVLYLMLANTPVRMPLSMIIAGIIPGALVLLLSLSGMLKYRWIRISGYAWYLMALCFMIGYQWSPENLVRLFKAEGFSLNLFVYVFIGGGVFLLLVSHLTQILLLIPPASRASVLDTVTGPLTYHKEQADMMADRFSKQKLKKWHWFVVPAYPIFLIANARLHFIPHGIVINLSIIAMFWLVKRHPLQAKPVPGPV